MASSNETMERFAHDVCVHVLEKFGIFKAPDDTRKQNKYIQHDFLPRISRSVVSFAIWIRTHFKNALEDKFKIAHLDDNEVMWIFEDQLLQSAQVSRMQWAEKVCVSLALCTEYVQFARTNNLGVSLNKLVIGWNKFFEKHLKTVFQKDFVFLSLYDYLEFTQMPQLGEFQEAFVSEYCLPYGKIECTMELAKECMEKRGLNISSERTIFGIKTFGDIDEGFFKKSGDFSESEEFEGEAAQSDIPQQFPKSSEGRSAPSDAPRPITTSPVRESVPSGACSQEPPETKEELKEKVDQILTRLEQDMEDLRFFLFEHGLLELKPGRRGGIRMRVINPKDKQPPPGPEGLI